jgi:hypothetical protein
MVLNKWNSGDTITEREANNHGVRKGTEAEISAILLADREDGDVFWNSTEGFPQVQTDATNDKRGNLAILLGADSTETTVTGTTPTQVKDLDYIKNSAGFKGNQLTIVARIKTSNAGTTGHLRVRTDGGGSDDLDLTTTSTAYEIKSGTIDITGKADGHRTIEFFGDDGTGHTVTIEAIEVYGI